MSTWEKPQIIVHIHKSLNFTVYDTKWIPSSAKCVVLGSHPRGTGAIQIYEVNKGELKLIVQTEKKSSFKCGTFGASSLHQRHLATGDFDGRLATWDLERLDYPVYSVKAHEGIINAIDGCGGVGIGNGAPEIVTGSRDGSVKVWDVRQKNNPVACMEPAKGEARRDCWAVAMGNSHNNEERFVCSGYDNGDVKMFDLRNLSLFWENNLKNGVCGLQFDRTDIIKNKLVAVTLEGKYHIYDLRTFNEAKGFASLVEKAHESTIWSVKHLPQNRDIFATTGGNGTVNIWKYNYPPKRFKKNEDETEEGVMGSVTALQNIHLSDQPISTLDWNNDKEGLFVCPSFDQSVRVCIVTKLNVV
ncbi:WD repeat-containing protein 92-like isoform X1 [Oopsacas minuta]|uniref:Dynein axonemal assembly factor 10 n=1 Tax=Oopsacas minuta TaxID=111878 RepID=A0AAV7KDY3_9METZ|nr:WD repeat-containing protein 92-like isoform X1 [Oopsacas minuta]